MNKEVEFNGRTITVRELTVREVINFSTDHPAEERDGAMELLLPNVPVTLLRQITGLTKEDILDVTPQEVEKVWVVVQEANPNFFAMLDRVREVMAQREATEKRVIADSPAPLPD